MKVIIDRRTWLRGEGSHVSCLRRESDSRQCCLGFVALALGQTEADITDQDTLCSIQQHNRTTGVMDLLSRAYPSNISLLGNAMELNDAQDLAPTTREWAIQQALAPLGLELEFVN